MTRWTVMVGLAAGCSITVESDDELGTTDPTSEEQDPSNGTTDEPGDGPPSGDCGGVRPGTYGGADQGDFEAEVVRAEMRVYVYSVDADGFLDGILDIGDDGALYGEDQGVWMDGTLDWDSCAMSGDWGAVYAPGVAAGWWEVE